MIKKKIALVCVAKEEDYYLQEWIDYHLLIGFDDIHIFQNNWRFKNPIENDKVHFHEWDYETVENEKPIWEKNLQAKCYTDFGINYCDEYEWAAFFDVDEFLVLKEYDDVKEFINDYSNFSCLIINWAVFCDNEITTFDTNYTTVIERFTKRWDKPHSQGFYQFKSICKLHKNMRHNTHWAEGEWVDPNFNIGNGPYNYSGSFNKAQLNHYYTKTYPEWINKTSKTRCDTGKVTLPVEVFNLNNHNDIDDYHALNFYKNKK
jgi:hypothetical protein